MLKRLLTRGFTTRLSLDRFFSEQKDPSYQLTDERTLEYMRMAADLSLISRFKNEDELLQYKNDFQAALMFIKKLDEVQVPAGTEPLGNVLEYYGGNEEKMRSKPGDFEDSQKVADIQAEIKRMNKNMQGSLVKTPKPFDRS
jgi:hypothetical protein